MEPKMELSEFVLRLLLLFLPGIICSQVVDTLTVHRKRTPFETLIQSFLFGLSAYFLCWMAVRVFAPSINSAFQLRLPTKLVFLNALQDRQARLSFVEIAFVCLTAFCQALFISTAHNHKLFHRVARALRISRKSGELDVWGIVFNSPEIQFATVRDFKHDLIYDGWIGFFSDDAKTSEVFLRDVSVYRNSTAKLLYNVGGVYLCVDQKEMVIECRDVPFTGTFAAKIQEKYERGISKGESAQAGRAGD